MRMATQPPTVGDTVREAMKARNVSQYALAAHLALSQAAVSRRLSGETEFSVGELSAAASLLDVEFVLPLATQSPSAPEATPPAVSVAGAPHAPARDVIPDPDVASGGPSSSAA